MHGLPQRVWGLGERAYMLLGALQKGHPKDEKLYDLNTPQEPLKLILKLGFKIERALRKRKDRRTKV